MQATQGLAAGFEVAQGAAALFGSESEDLQKAILKVQEPVDLCLLEVMQVPDPQLTQCWA